MPNFNYYYDSNTLSINDFTAPDTDALAGRYSAETNNADAFNNPNLTDAQAAESPNVVAQLDATAREFKKIFNLTDEQFNDFDGKVLPILEHTMFGTEFFSDAFGSINFSADRRNLLVNDYMRRFAQAIIAPSQNAIPVSFFNEGSFDTFGVNVQKPERPGLVKRILHWFRKSLFAEEFNNYQRDLNNYNRLTETNVALNDVATVQNRLMREYSSAMEKMRDNARTITSQQPVSAAMEAELEYSNAEVQLIRTTMEERRNLRNSVVARAQKLRANARMEDELTFGDQRFAGKESYELEIRLNKRDSRFFEYSKPGEIGIGALDRVSTRLTLAHMALFADGYTFDQILDTENPALFEARARAGKRVMSILQSGDMKQLVNLMADAADGYANYRMGDTTTRSNAYFETMKMHELMLDRINYRQFTDWTKPNNPISKAIEEVSPEVRANYNRFHNAIECVGVLVTSAPEIVVNCPFLYDGYRTAGIAALFPNRNGMNNTMHNAEILQAILSPASNKTLGESVEIFNRGRQLHTDFYLGKDISDRANLTPLRHQFSKTEQLNFEGEMLNAFDNLLPNNRVSINLNAPQNANVNQNVAQNVAQNVNQTVNQAENAPVQQNLPEQVNENNTNNNDKKRANARTTDAKPAQRMNFRR